MTAEAVTPEIVPDILPAATVLEGLRDGQVLEEIGEAMREMSQLVLLHNKKGELTIKLRFAPLPNRMVVVSDEIISTPPKASLPQTIRYVDRVGNLRQENPDRPDLNARLREIAAGEGDKVREL